jgi:hypothetical protein
MYYLPLTGTPTRELFEVSDLIHADKAPTFRDAKRLAASAFQERSGLRGITYICRRACGDLVLATFGPRGGCKQQWNFTTGK